MYFSGRAEVTWGEMREAEKRGPRVDWDMLAPPVVAAGDCHMMAAAAEKEESNWIAVKGILVSCALKKRSGN